MRNFKVTLEYNGSNFHGWQKQTGKRTVQEVVENAFSLLTGESVSVEGSGRTDSGVHALGQVASVAFENQIPIEKIKDAVNNFLPSDVRILKVQKADANFHARFSAKRKTYEYVVQVGGQRSAIKHNLQGFYPFEVDLQKMTDASKLLIGKHNFRGFCSSGAKVSSFERKIFDIKIKKNRHIIKFEVTGNGFLYNMVRILVGTLLDVGRGKLTAQDIQKALETGERKYAGKTMEACGLYLKKVEYEKQN